MAANNNNKNLNVPSLRFPGFTDEWHTATMQYIAPLQRGFDLPTQDVKDGSVPVVYSNGILRCHSEGKCDAPGVITGRSGTIGKFTFIEKGRYWPHNTSLWVTNFNGNYPKFVYYLYSTIQIEQYGTGSGVPTLNRNDVHRHITFIPTISEQKKIADFLTLLDERIATQRKIIEDLKYLIKGLREVIFKMPCSRYVLLGEIAELYQPKTISTAELQEDGYLVYGANGVIGHYHSYNHENPQISITCRGNTCGQVNLTSPFSWITGNAMVVNIDGNEEIDQSYLFHFLSFYNFSSIISGSGQPQIVRTPLAKIKVPYLELGDQQKISRLLSSITSRIEIEECHLNCLLLQKDYLVSVLFI